MIVKDTRSKIILTADDFGKNELANERILELAEAGKLDRVSVMIDGDCSPEEAGRLKRTGVKLDIHFELGWQKKKRGMTRENTVKQGIIFLANHFSASRREKVADDWQRQIENFREVFGRYPDGLNSHEYVHLFPAYFKTALELAGRYGVSFIRFGKKGLNGEKNIAKLVLGNLRKWDRKRFVSSGLQSSDFFSSLDWISDFEKFAKNFPDGETEIACHPEREEEYNLIISNF